MFMDFFGRTPVRHWELGASLTNYPGQLPLYQYSTPGVTLFWNDNFVGTTTNYSTNLTSNPFTTSVKISEGNRRLLMTPVLGQVTGTNITVYQEPDRNQAGQDQRTWIDGIGYQLIKNQILSPLVLSNGNLTMTYSGTAGRKYLWEVTDNLNPPVTWTPLQTSTADSNGVVSFTTTPTGSPDFYRVQDVTPPPAPYRTDGNGWRHSGVADLDDFRRCEELQRQERDHERRAVHHDCVNIDATNFVATGLTDFTTYYFVISALNFNGEGANSSEANATPFLRRLRLPRLD